MDRSILESRNVRVVGNGDKTLVLSHGFGTDQSTWQRILPFFRTTYRVVLFDLVCSGSVNPAHLDFNKYNNLNAFAEDLLAIVDALGITKCYYVGHSVSAMIGLLASIARPNLFLKLVLIGASPRFMNDVDFQGGFEQEEIDKVFNAMESNYKAWVNGFAPLAVGADVPAAVREFSRTLFNMRPDITLFVSKMVFYSDFRGILKDVRTPCCLIQTCNDLAVPGAVGEYLRANLGGTATLETLRTEGHLPHLTAPHLLAYVLRRALAQTMSL